MSVPVAAQTRPSETAAADPPELPPGTLSRPQGLYPSILEQGGNVSCWRKLNSKSVVDQIVKGMISKSCKVYCTYKTCTDFDTLSL